MKRSRGIILGAMIFALAIMPLFLAYAAEKVPPKAATKPIEAPLVLAEAAQEAAQQKEALKTAEGTGPGRGGGAEAPHLSVRGFEILQGPEEGTRLWGNRGTYTYNGGGEHEDIKFRVQVYNGGPGNFEAPVSITVYSGTLQLSLATPVVSLHHHEVSDYFEVVLHQSELIARGELAPRTYDFKAKIKYYDGASWGTAPAGSRVILTLSNPHPPGRAIPQETMVLTSEPSRTGTIHYNHQVDATNIQAGGGCYQRRGFISFDLSPLREKINQWKGEEWTGFEIRSATLTLDLFRWGFNTDSWSSRERVHEYIGNILLDVLDYGDGLDSGDYSGPMISNIRSFPSADGMHTLEHLEAYVRFQIENEKGRIQFRLRLMNEDHDAFAAFLKPCHLSVVLSPKGQLRLTPGATKKPLAR